MTKNFLPIGSIVLLEGANKRLMIYGILQINQENNKQYDYIGCLYPEGLIDAKKNYLFDAENIEKVEFIGFVDSERQVFMAKLDELLGTATENSESTNSDS